MHQRQEDAQGFTKQTELGQVAEGKGEHVRCQVTGILPTRAGRDRIRPGAGSVVPIVQSKRLFGDEAEIRIRIGKGHRDGQVEDHDRVAPPIRSGQFKAVVQESQPARAVMGGKQRGEGEGGIGDHGTRRDGEADPAVQRGELPTPGTDDPLKPLVQMPVGVLLAEEDLQRVERVGVIGRDGEQVVVQVQAVITTIGLARVEQAGQVG